MVAVAVRAVDALRYLAAKLGLLRRGVWRLRPVGPRQRSIIRRDVAEVVVAKLLRHCIHGLVLAHALAEEHELELQVEVWLSGQVGDVLVGREPLRSRNTVSAMAREAPRRLGPSLADLRFPF